jgi:uncharacterized protein YbjQ (UPF0145 family)
MSFLITTTESLDGYDIESYLGPLIVPSVGAGNFIKDWLARFTDFFGGKSRSYQKTYEKMLTNGLSEMTDQAKAHGANGILGLRVETTNISGGTSLISILVYGTAVVVRPIITTKC